MDLSALTPSIDTLAAVITAAKLSLLISLAAAFFSYLCCLILAYLHPRLSGGLFWQFMKVLFCLPLSFPPLFSGVLLLILLGPQSSLGKLLFWWDLEILFTPGALIIASLLVNFGFAFLNLEGGLSTKARDAFDAGSIYSKKRSQAFWYLEWPILRPTLMRGSLIVGIKSLGEFGAAIMVSGQIPGKTLTLPLLFYLNMQDLGALDSLIFYALVYLVLVGTLVALAYTLNRPRRALA